MPKIFPIMFVLMILLLQAGFVLAVDDPCKAYCDSLNTDSPQQPPPGQVCFCNPLKYGSVEDILDAVIGWIFKISLIVGPAMIIVGGIMYMAAGGSPARVQIAQKIIRWTVVGFLIILFSRGLENLIQYIIGVK